MRISQNQVSQQLTTKVNLAMFNEGLDLIMAGISQVKESVALEQDISPCKPPDGEKRPSMRDIEKSNAEHKALMDEIREISESVKARTEYSAPRRNDFPTLTIMGDREKDIQDIKAVGSRWATLARRLGCNPYPADSVTNKPYKRGCYVSDGDAYFDLVELFNRFLDAMDFPE